jgi:hypothetical protein
VNASEFAAKWSVASVKESAGAKEHFADLCRMLGYPTPIEADPAGEWYAFEKGAEKTVGGDGFADVWKRGHFAWEYKGKRKDLKAAYSQLLEYRETLENPPLLVELATRGPFMGPDLRSRLKRLSRGTGTQLDVEHAAVVMVGLVEALARWDPGGPGNTSDQPNDTP